MTGDGGAIAAVDEAPVLEVALVAVLAAAGVPEAAPTSSAGVLELVEPAADVGGDLRRRGRPSPFGVGFAAFAATCLRIAVRRLRSACVLPMRLLETLGTLVDMARVLNTKIILTNFRTRA